MTQSKVPVVTLSLIAANLAAAYAMVIDPRQLGQFAFQPVAPTWSSAMVSLFLHQNIAHLLGNMVFLAAVGPAVERAAGAARFFVVYLAGGLAGVGMYALAAPNGTPLIGASGAIAGCVGYYAMRFARARVPVAPNVNVPIVAMIGFWAFLQVAGAFVGIEGRVVGGTAYLAHLGGFLAGLALSLAFRVPAQVEHEVQEERMRESMDRSPVAIVRWANEVLRGDPEHKEAWWARLDALEQMGEREEAVRHIMVRLKGRNGEANRLVERLAEWELLGRLDARHRLKLADQIKSECPGLAKALLESVVSEPIDEPQRPEAMLALATMEWERTPERARVLIRQLAEQYPLHPALELARVRGWTS